VDRLPLGERAMSDEPVQCFAWEIQVDGQGNPRFVQCTHQRPCPDHEQYIVIPVMEDDEGSPPPAAPQAGLRLVPKPPEKTTEQRIKVRFVDRREEFILALRHAAGHIESGGVTAMAIQLTFEDGNVANKVVLGPKGDALKLAGTMELVRHRLIEGLA
jgi:hypothetical protein